MFKTIKQVFAPRNKDLRKRILFTLGCLAIFIAGTSIKVPNTNGIDSEGQGSLVCRKHGIAKS